MESWAADFGSPYLVSEEEDSADAEVVEDAELTSHQGLDDQLPLAFVDGVRRAEAWLFLEDESREVRARGVAGAYGCGASVVRASERAQFESITVDRLLIWGSGQTEQIPAVAGGWTWRVTSISDTAPDAPLHELQIRMRQTEGVIAERLAFEGNLVVVDGPLTFVRSRDLPVAGYVKTHHRALLPAELHRTIPKLETGSRSSLFQLGDDRYSCYLRVARPGMDGNPWSGIVRLEFPQAPGLDAASQVATQLAGQLPRYAGIPHRDPRAPQNLQPIGALESHLRHLLGDSGLAARAVRDSAAARSSNSNRGEET